MKTTADLIEAIPFPEPGSKEIVAEGWIDGGVKWAMTKKRCFMWHKDGQEFFAFEVGAHAIVFAETLRAYSEAQR